MSANLSQLASRLLYLSQQSGEWREEQTVAKGLEELSRTVPGGIRDTGKEGDKALRDLLYGVENLRKRPGAED